LIVTASTESTEAIQQSAKTIKLAARALRVVLWGMGLLERLDNKLRSTSPVIDIATRHAEANLSKVCRPLKLPHALAHTNDNRDVSIGAKHWKSLNKRMFGWGLEVLLLGWRPAKVESAISLVAQAA
jgi:hypothetical protein